jgi:hypothetical protein
MSSVVTSQSQAGEPDWTTAALDRIDSAVSAVRDNATTRLVVAARALVYGLLAAVLSVAILLLVVVALQRMLVTYLADLHVAGLNTHPGRSVWVADAILGGIFTLIGVFLLRKASTHTQSTHTQE